MPPLIYSIIMLSWNVKIIITILKLVCFKDNIAKENINLLIYLKIIILIFKHLYGLYVQLEMILYVEI
jgi:hypothetical protein